MKRHAETARRYSEALVAAALTVRRAAERSRMLGREPAKYLRWQAERPLWLDAATAQRRAAEA